MLSPRNRMRHSAEFGSVMRSGRRASRDCLGVVYLPPPSGVADADPRGSGSWSARRSGERWCASAYSADCAT
ncbi:hypothetical protein Ndas_4867 [Nocardiopsis dassonvillei subsp. dassonvillei DSM 43111]|uniref:Uncharacterized protein n=1 Tax=Nocardiopsis dassonvillei (strain ATCC 23218 / DSM 43111 / CIP 107115 / JCM 7437 / KCTC 9190 / NBRC 14626 / NCTC 10488 / NRRL B-5397 / IMRU 509) TaxID=446468 RepID=D7B156_NOCDD|nr:hypothetical protein Ndas_4867 [Nocardiopsis dassonvillei subsp. dassonvillei DSM 43111]